MYRLLTASAKSIFIFFYSLKFLNFKDWLAFWFTFPIDQVVTLDNLRLAIRTNNMEAKIVDLYMAVSCILWKQYDQENLPPTGTVIDIGGHIGSFSIYASPNTSRVITYEPDVINFKRLRHNIEINNSKNVLAINKGVAGTTGDRLLFQDSANSAAHTIALKSTGGSRTIECVSLEEVFRENNISTCDFMKLDCEGAEFEILMNASQDTLAKIKRISMEYHEGYDLNKLLEHLKQSDFKIIKNEKENSYQGMIWAKR